MTIILDSTTINTTSDLYNQLNTFLHFPDYFGYNLDALYDRLTEINEPITLKITNPIFLEKNLGTVFYHHFLRVCENAGIPIKEL